MFFATTKIFQNCSIPVSTRNERMFVRLSGKLWRFRAFLAGSTISANSPTCISRLAIRHTRARLPESGFSLAAISSSIKCPRLILPRAFPPGRTEQFAARGNCLNASRREIPASARTDLVSPVNSLTIVETRAGRMRRAATERGKSSSRILTTAITATHTWYRQEEHGERTA